MFNFFKKKVASVGRFRNRMPFEAARPVEYAIPNELCEKVMLPRLEKLFKSLQSGELDSGNADILDALIFAPALLSVYQHQIDHEDHKDSIHRLQARYKADAGFIQRDLESRKEALEEYKGEYSRFLKEHFPCESSSRKEHSNNENV